MKVCLLNDSYPPLIDGVANTVVNYARNLTSFGDEAMVVTPDHPDADDSASPWPVVRYSGIDLRKWMGYFAGNPFSTGPVKGIGEFLPDVIHTHCPAMSTVVARSVRDRVDAPIILTYHTKFDIDIANAVRSKAIQESAISGLVNNVEGCDEVWAVSRGAGENLRSLGYQGEYIVMPNGVDIPKGRLPESAIEAATQGYDLPHDVPMFLFVGRLMWYKGLKIILDAMAGLKSQHMDFRMVFIGKGVEEAEIKAYSHSLNLDDKVIFTGAIYDHEVLRAWYCRADLFLFPSTYDTNGLVVREAAACGLATVMVGGSCAAEDVTDGRNGFYIEENAVSLAVCLARIIPNIALAKAAGQHAMDEIYISWETAVKMAEERYGVVLEKYRSGGYKRHDRPTDELLRMTGNIVNLRGEAADRLKEIRSDAGERIREMKDNAEEVIEELRDSAEEHREERRARREEQRHRLEERIEQRLNRMFGTEEIAETAELQQEELEQNEQQDYNHEDHSVDDLFM